MTEAQRLLAEKTLFGAAAGKTLDSTLLAGAAGYTTASAAATKHGTATAAANVATSTLSGSMSKVSAALQNAGVTLGNFFLPILKTVMGWVAIAAQDFAFVLPGALTVIGTAFNILGKIIGPAITFWVGLVKVWIAVIQTIVGVVVNVVNAIKGPIISIGGFFATAFGGVATIVGKAFGGVATIVKGAINGVIGIINFFIGLIDAIQVHIHVGPVGLDWNGLKLGKIPTLDTGGIVTTPTLALLAANSRPEAVIPLGSANMLSGGGGGGGSNVVINVTSNDGQAVVNALKRYFYANGPIPITVNRARALGS
jgi:phage-related protein